MPATARPYAVPVAAGLVATCLLCRSPGAIGLMLIGPAPLPFLGHRRGLGVGRWRGRTVAVAVLGAAVALAAMAGAMRWKGAGAAAVLSLRRLTDTPERWGQFWGRIERCVFPAAA